MVKAISKLTVAVLASIGAIVVLLALGLGGYLLILRSGRSETSLPIEDCAWEGAASAWLDTNEDGARQTGELPLAGVQFLADNVTFEADVPELVASDQNGQAELVIFPLDCRPELWKISVYAIPPPGFEPTTPWHVLLASAASERDAHEILEFGFAERISP
jgi:hypothetical protein